jgi:hypothetical protein
MKKTRINKMPKKKELRNPRGAPKKLELMGETCVYAPKNVPKIVYKAFKKAVKTMMGTMTMADYLRIRMVNDSKKRLPGKEYPPEYCNYNGMIDWSKYKWIKDSKDRFMYISMVHYPRDSWEIFLHNCAVEGIVPKTKICGYMIELIEEYIRWRKSTKKKQKK